jgi:hypothetical protein
MATLEKKHGRLNMFHGSECMNDAEIHPRRPLNAMALAELAFARNGSYLKIFSLIWGASQLRNIQLTGLTSTAIMSLSIVDGQRRKNSALINGCHEATI